MSKIETEHDPQMPDSRMHLARPNEPVLGRVLSNEICTANRKAAGFVRHVEIEVAGTPLEGVCLPGQSIGILPDGNDHKGRPHQVRLYSLASPAHGEDGHGKVISTTVKRTIDEHWDSHRLFLGVASNYLCDAQEGDELRLTGPAGKRFLLPTNAADHAYLFFATGTGIAPFRGMVLDLIKRGCENDITLIMGAPYATDLIYHGQLLDLARKHKNFRYLTAISRERQDDGHDRMYVQDRLTTDRDALLPQLENEKNLIYVCGLAGMELGIFQHLAAMLAGQVLEQYLRVDSEALADITTWDRKMIHRQIKHTKRVMLEVYA